MLENNPITGTSVEAPAAASIVLITVSWGELFSLSSVIEKELPALKNNQPTNKFYFPYSPNQAKHQQTKQF